MIRFSLLTAELRKVWRSRFFLLAFCVLLAVNLFLLWFGTGHTPGNVSAAAYGTLEREIGGMDMQEMDVFLHDALARTQGLTRVAGVLRNEAWNGGKPDEYWRAEYAEEFEKYYDLYMSRSFLHYGETLAQEYRFLNTIVLEFEQVNGYEEFLDSIEQKAAQLSSISIFANSGSGYDMENIRVTDEAFKDMRGTPILYYPQKGLMTALDFALTDVVAVFAMVLIATVLVRTERDNGLLALIRATPAGRLATAGAKLAALAVSLFVVLVGLYGVNLAYCGALYGLGPLTRTIQSVPGLMRSTWKLTVGGYLGCFLLSKWAAALVCGAWVMLAMLCARHLFTGALGALALLAANLLIRSLIPATSRWNVLKYANLVSLLRTNELLGGYRNLYWFDHPIPLLLVECVAAVLFGVLFLAAFCHVFSRKIFTAAPHGGNLAALPLPGARALAGPGLQVPSQPGFQPKPLTVLQPNSPSDFQSHSGSRPDPPETSRPQNLPQTGPHAQANPKSRLPLFRAPAFTTPLRQETYKLFFMQGAALLLVLFAAFQAYTAVTTESYIDADEIYYQYYMKHIEGPLTQQSIEWLREQNEEFTPIYQLQAAMASGQITPQEFGFMMQGYGSLQQKMNIFLRVWYKAKAVQQTPGAQLVYETGWLKLLDFAGTADLPDTLWAAALSALCCAGLFAMERQTGMVHVIGTTPLGQRHTVRCKLGLALGVSGAVTVLGLLPRVWVAARDYGLAAWTAPVSSIGEYAAAPGIPLFLLFVLLVLARFAANACMACATLALSQKTGSTFGALFASLLLFALPPLLSVSGLKGAKWLGVYPLFHTGALFASGTRVACFLLLFITAAACWICGEYLYEHFAKTQSRR